MESIGYKQARDGVMISIHASRKNIADHPPDGMRGGFTGLMYSILRGSQPVMQQVDLAAFTTTINALKGNEQFRLLNILYHTTKINRLPVFVRIDATFPP